MGIGQRPSHSTTAELPVVVPHGGGASLGRVALGALGVVYGDIGTSPLYAVKECVTAPHGVDVSPANVLGVLSLVFWSLTLVVVVKYLVFVLRADNNGEGGVLALMSLATTHGEDEDAAAAANARRRWRRVLVGCG